MTINGAIKFAKENVLAYTSEMAEFKVLAIEALEKQMQSCGNCRHADHSPITHMIYCLEHSCTMSGDNCCRNWGEDDCE